VEAKGVEAKGVEANLNLNHRVGVDLNL